MSKKWLALATATLGGAMTSCDVSKAPFSANTEFGLRLRTDVNTKVAGAHALKFAVDYPESFYGDVVDGAIIRKDADITVSLSSLEHKDTRLCVNGDLVAVENSKGVRGLDDGGASFTIQTIQSAPTTTLVTQNVCTGQGDTLSCMPMTFPMEFPGSQSSSLHWSTSTLRFKSGSEMIFKLSAIPCKGSK